MSTLSRPAQLVFRRIALILAFVCFWMSAVATLHHTDKFDEGATFATSQETIHTVTPTAVDTPCVAHQWMDAWHTLHTGGLPIVLHPIVCAILSQRPDPLLHQTHFDYASLRAPPVTLS